MQCRLASMSGLLLSSLLLGGCAIGERMAPVARVDPVADTRPHTHTVRKGDTLYAVAWTHGLDYRVLAARNRLEPPFIIYPGQVLDLVAMSNDTAQAGVSVAAVPGSSELAQHRIDEGLHGTRAVPSPGSAENPGSGAGSSAEQSQPGDDPKRADTFDDNAPVKAWRWPTEGRVIGSFGKSGGKGVHLAGRFEQPVVAAADGRVVYRGTGLVGYGQLIVLKHNKHYFSAYGHNARILVEEGDVVRGGQRIALMGSSGSDRVKLHFEVRHDGKPVDPLRVLPPRGG